MNESFFNLTPDVVIRSVEEAGFRSSDHCMALNSLENRVYDVGLEDGSHVVVKFYRPGRWSYDQIQEEHDFLFELNENEIPAVIPILFPDGRTVQKTENIFFAVWPRIGGRIPDELNEEELQIVGRTLARMHNVGSSRTAHHRVKLDSEQYIKHPLHILETAGLIPHHLIERYKHAANDIASYYNSFLEKVPVHRIHGDCHIGNLLRGDAGWHIVDFDDFLTGPAVQDIWMLAPGHYEIDIRRREILLDAYRSFREFDSDWLRMIRPLQAMRWIHYSSWIARRWEDPSFPSAFPHYGTEDYWEQEVADLEQEVKRIFESDNESIIGRETENLLEEQEQLTNKDFFWDWDDTR